MPKKTAAEYEAMIGGLMTRIEDLYARLGNVTANAEAWEAKAKKLESKEPRLVIDWESMCKDRDKAIEELDDFRVAVAKALGIPAEASIAELEAEVEYLRNNHKESCLWPSTIIESDQKMADGRPRKIAAVPNWCIHKIETYARKKK